jgi:hypothetical protein
MDEPEQTVFVKIDDFEKILAKISALTGHVRKAKEQLQAIKELKNREDSSIADWENELQVMEEKINFVTRTMAKRE